jgi:hypothetical protein
LRETAGVTLTYGAAGLFFGLLFGLIPPSLRDAGLVWKTPLSSACVASFVWYVLAARRPELTAVRGAALGVLVVLLSEALTWIMLGAWRPVQLPFFTAMSLILTGPVAVPLGTLVGMITARRREKASSRLAP